MDIEFVWLHPTITIPRDVLESKIRQDIETDSTTVPCHSGKITIYLSSTDPLETAISGRLFCLCGKAFVTFSGASDGSKLTYRSHIANNTELV
jgi:hypothetical protein